MSDYGPERYERELERRRQRLSRRRARKQAREDLSEDILLDEDLILADLERDRYQEADQYLNPDDPSDDQEPPEERLFS